MIDFSALRPSSRLGRWLRLPLRWLPPTARLRVLQGPLAGARWVVGSGVHGYWLGSYEARIQRRLAALLSPGEVMFDVGAHVGFYSLLASRRVGPHGRVFAFEPLPANLEHLREHVRLNRAGNVTIVERAVGEWSGVVRFEEGRGTAMGRLVEAGGFDVPSTSLDDFVLRESNPAPSLIKIDVEGKERTVLSGAMEVLRRFHPRLVVEVHDEAASAACRALLAPFGYRIAIESIREKRGQRYLFATDGRT